MGSIRRKRGRPIPRPRRIRECRRGLDALLAAAPLLPVIDGYWERATLNRRALAQRGLEARLADALIAQSCIDADIPLITGAMIWRRSHTVTISTT